MAYTQSQINALEAAMALGARRVKYDDGKEVEFASLRDMERQLSRMKREIGTIARGPIRHYPHHDKGLES